MTYPTVRRLDLDLVSRPLTDIEGAVQDALVLGNVRAKRIAVGAGSRGIANYGRIVRTVVNTLKGLGADPFVVPAMGSHGGATPEGQREILTEWGVTAEAMGVEVCCSDDWVAVGECHGRRLTMLRAAWESDGVVLVNRVKRHTDYDGPIQSGLSKMLAIGLAGPEGAGVLHACGLAHLGENIVAHATELLRLGKVIGGVAILEDGHEQTAKVQWVDADRWLQDEPGLLDEAQAMFPTLPFESLDSLVVGQIGKNFSGTGMDTNVIGRKHLATGRAAEPPHVKILTALGLSEASHGNGLGVGLADIVSQRLIDAIDFDVMRTNALTSSFYTCSKVPVAMPTDRAVLDYLFQRAALARFGHEAIAFIPNTLQLGRVYATEAALERVAPDRTFKAQDPQPIPMHGDRLALWDA
jgi:hypothetical protein